MTGEHLNKSLQLLADHLERAQDLASDENQMDVDYLATHFVRYSKTFEYLPEPTGDAVALELGASAIFQVILRDILTYDVVYGSVWSRDICDKYRLRKYVAGGVEVENVSFSIDLESELLPLNSSSVDFVMCCEVLEHMDVDPMFLLAEISRVLKVGGMLLVTTPNSCSARNLWKIAQGIRPHFYMQYRKDRSPYRHNIEYDVSTVLDLLKAAGFDLKFIGTDDVFEEPSTEGVALIKRANLPEEYRGDDIFAVAVKTRQFNDRWPSGIYI